MNTQTKDSSFDYSLIGEIENRPLGKIRKIIARNMTSSWNNIPHVTHHDEVDVSHIEQWRKQFNTQAEAKSESAVHFTLLPILIIAVVNALKKYPEFNASLDESGDVLILKRYYNIGIAVDTEHGLLVPIIKNVNDLSLEALAIAAKELAEKTRAGLLTVADTEGGSFSVTSLGRHGGTGFTPIIKTPEVAILGVSRLIEKVVAVGGQPVSRPMLPLSLSYDHRAIDGAMAARFMTYVRAQLQQPDELLTTL